MRRPITLEPGARIAASNSVCAAPGCNQLIYQGTVIIKAPGGGWQHANCAQPVRLHADPARQA